MCGTELRRKLIENRLPARHEDDVDTATCEFVCEGGTEAVGTTGDDGPRAILLRKRGRTAMHGQPVLSRRRKHSGAALLSFST